MTNDNLYRVPKWQIGDLSTGWYSHEEVLDLAQSFFHTELFLDAVEYLLEIVVDVFELRLVSEVGLLSFLELSTHTQRNEVFQITSRLEVLYLAWQLASDLNPAVASFQGDTLQKLRAEIHLLNADCDGDPLQKVKAAMNSLRDINSAFAWVNKELGIHRAKYDLAGRVSGENGDKKIPTEVAQDPPPPFLAHVVHDDSTVLGPSGEDNPLKGLDAEVKPTSASPSIAGEPYLGLVFHHDSTVSRLGDDYKDKRIRVEPQPLLLLKFVHDGGQDGRTQNAIISALSIDQNNLKSVKNRVNETLIPLGLSLGPRGQYAVTDKVT